MHQPQTTVQMVPEWLTVREQEVMEEQFLPVSTGLPVEQDGIQMAQTDHCMVALITQPVGKPL